MEATIRRTPAPNEVLKFALAILGGATIWRLAPGTPASTALLVVVGLFLLASKRPVWALAAFLVAQLTVTSYMVGLPGLPPISLRLLLLLLTGLILWPAIAQKKLQLGPRARAVLVPFALLAGVSLVANMTNSGLGYAFKDLRSMMAGLLLIVFLPAVVRNLKDFKILCAVALVAVSTSATIAVMQHYGTLGMDLSTLRPGFMERGSDLRVPGMAESYLELSYALSLAIPVALGTFLTKGLKGKTRIILVVSVVLMSAALYFTYTRSAQLAIILGIGTLLLFFKTRISGRLVLVLVLLTLIFMTYSGTGENQYLGGRSEVGQETSSLARKVLWQAGIAIAMDNPVLGIGGDQFTTVSPRYDSRVDPDLIAREEAYWSYRDLGSQQPHNDFLYMAISYGFLALVAYLWIYFAMLRSFLDSFRKARQPLVKGLALGLAAGVVAYAANAFYHNLMITFPLFWILAGFSVAIAKLAYQEKGRNHALQGRARGKGRDETA